MYLHVDVDEKEAVCIAMCLSLFTIGVSINGPPCIQYLVLFALPI